MIHKTKKQNGTNSRHPIILPQNLNPLVFLFLVLSSSPEGHSHSFLLKQIAPNFTISVPLLSKAKKKTDPKQSNFLLLFQLPNGQPFNLHPGASL